MTAQSARLTDTLRLENAGSCCTNSSNCSGGREGEKERQRAGVNVSGFHPLECSLSSVRIVTHAGRKKTGFKYLLTDVIVCTVHGVFLQAVSHDVSTHEGVRRSPHFFVVVILVRIHRRLGQSAEIHVAAIALGSLAEKAR